MSYKCRDFNDVKREFIKSVLNIHEPKILLLQEHWLSDEQLSILGNIETNFLSVGVSGFACHDVLCGRPTHLTMRTVFSSLTRFKLPLHVFRRATAT
jgi:hypothetical protein